MMSSMPLMAQDDDMYIVPKKSSTVKAATDTYYSGSDRNVDEYNRRGKFRSSVTELNDSDIIAFDGENGVYPDSIEVKGRSKRYRYYDGDIDDDYLYSRELNRWYGLYNPWFYGYGYISPFYRGYGWYSPYYSSWYGYYDPWYSPYYSGWYGYYDPWYYGYYGGWYSPWYYSGYWGGGYYGSRYRYSGGGLGEGYSNRGRVTSSASSNGLVGSNRRTGGNVYNDIAKRSQTRSGVVSSSRSVGSRNIDVNRGNTRTYTPSYNTPSYSSPSYSGGSRSSGGGSFGGGSRGGGGVSGGGHGGRR